MRNITKKKLTTLSLIGALALGTVGCGRTDNKTTTETETKTQVTTEVIAPTEEEYEVEYIEDTFTPGDLDINSDASIEYEANSIYEDYKEWFDDHAMDVDSIKNIIFILNDKYTDEFGNSLMNKEIVNDACYDIELLLGNAGSAILQKFDNINTIETDEEIGKDIDNSWKIIEYPSLTRFIDSDIVGGKAIIEKITEFEELRDYEVDLMNETNTYDRERINEFVRNMEINDYNNNSDNMDNVRKNGHQFLMSAYKKAVLDFAAVANPQTIYLDGYTAVDENIKINPTNEERFLENDIITLVSEGLLDASTVNNIVSEVEKSEALSYTIEEETLLEKYAINSDYMRLVMSYAHYLTTMAYYKYDKDMCNFESQMVDEVEEIKKETSLNTEKKLVLC